MELAENGSASAVPQRPPRTIQEQMIQRGIKFTFSDQDYHACLAIIGVVLGYQPTLNQFAKVWGDAGFWSFHLMFKNSFNFPYSMLGTNPDIDDLFLVLYASSKEGGCDYCMAHSVACALRTGSLPDRIICEGSNRKRDEALYIASKSLSRFPADLTTNEVIEMKRHFTTDKIEWIVLTIAASGYLNLMSMAGGLALEDESTGEQAWLMKETGWEGRHVDWSPEDVDVENAHIPNPQFLSILLKATKYMPSAILEETKWTYGVPMTFPKISTYLMEKVGYSFPLLKNTCHFRAVTATYGCIMRDNFTPENTTIGLINKGLVQMMFGSYFTDQFLQDDAESLIEAMVKRNHLQSPPDQVYDAVYNLAENPPPANPRECQLLLEELAAIQGIGTPENAAILILARAVMERPTKVEPVIVQEVSSLLTCPQSCEVVQWVGMMVAFHRVLRFYEVKNNTPTELWETNDPVDLVSSTMDGGTTMKVEFNHHSDDITTPTKTSAPANRLDDLKKTATTFFSNSFSKVLAKTKKPHSDQSQSARTLSSESSQPEESSSSLDAAWRESSEKL